MEWGEIRNLGLKLLVLDMNFNRKVIGFLLAMLLGVAGEVFAGPAFPLPFKAKTADGREINVRLIGDEHFHYYQNIDNGEKLLARQDGLLTIASEEQLEALKAEGMQARSKCNDRRKARAVKRRAEGNDNAITKRGLVILVNYTDVKMSSTHGRERWSRQFNEEGYHDNGHIGSVRDYFRDQSYGQLTIDFDVVGPYTLSHERAYYGAHDEYGGHDIHPCEMVAEACRMADKDVNFADYDWDGDGEVEQVFVIYAGGGEHAGAGADCIWPHEYALSYGAWGGDGPGRLNLDGVRVNTYAVSCERYFTTSSMDAIGAACHEFSHCLGLMDIYDTSYGGNPDMGDWDVLSSGSYNGGDMRGNVPCGYTAFERYYSGWLDIVDLTSTETITDMPALNDEPVAYSITNPGFEDEFFILENRQNNRWFQYPGNAHGLMIYHIDWDNEAWWYNNMNSGDHSRVSIVPADGNYNNTKNVDYQGDLFPGYNNVTSFNDDSHEKCGGKLFNKNTDGTYFLHYSINNITENDGKISFYFSVPKSLDAPVLSQPTQNEDGVWWFHWKKVKEADSYRFEMKRLAPLSSITEEPLVCEDFSSLTKEGTSDIANAISNVMGSEGWTGYHLYTSKQRIRLGTQIGEGYIQTPLLHSETGELTCSFSLKNIGSAENETYLQVINASGRTLYKMDVNNDGQSHDYVINVPTDEDGCQCYVRIFATTRAYLDDLTIHDGSWYDDSALEDFIDICTEDDTWQWNDRKEFDVTGSIGLHITDEADLPGYGYYRCRVQARCDDGTISSYSEPVYIINSRPFDETMGITTVSNGENGVIYDLMGRRLYTTPSRGMYISGGKLKMINK